jgi:hypothetical protein
MRNISRARTCHYHTHSLSVFAGIPKILTEVRNQEELSRLPRFDVALAAMKSMTRGTPTGRNALSEFFKSDQDPHIKHAPLGCLRTGIEELTFQTRNELRSILGL